MTYIHIFIYHSYIGYTRKNIINQRKIAHPEEKVEEKKTANKTCFTLSDGWQTYTYIPVYTIITTSWFKPTITPNSAATNDCRMQ